MSIQMGFSEVVLNNLYKIPV